MYIWYMHDGLSQAPSCKYEEKEQKKEKEEKEEKEEDDDEK